jgi:hypothetical protein
MTDEPNQLPKAAAVAVLIERLRVLLSPHDDDVIKLQSQFVVALGSVAKFLAGEGRKDLALKFIGLADAIGQLKNGIVADVVRPTPGVGRGPDGIVVWSLRHEVVKGLELIRGKMGTIEKAAKYIADNYPGFDRLKRNPKASFDRLKRNRKASLAKAILSWRRRIYDGDVPEAEVDTLAHHRSFFEQYGSENRSRAEMFALGKRLLDQAAERTTKAVF